MPDQCTHRQGQMMTVGRVERDREICQDAEFEHAEKELRSVSHAGAGWLELEGKAGGYASILGFFGADAADWHVFIAGCKVANEIARASSVRIVRLPWNGQVFTYMWKAS